MTDQVSSVFLQDTHSGSEVAAQLIDGITEGHLDNVEEHWQRARVEGLYRLKSEGVAPKDWPQSWHWHWRNKQQAVRGILAYRGFCIVCDDRVQGLMQVITTLACRLPEQKGKPLVYVDYLESAPWNQAGFAETPRFKGVGTVMLAAAVQLSRDEGFRGRLGLHSLPQSEPYYNRLGMESLGPDPDKQGLVYFEMTPQKAAEFYP
ncbi:MAG: GNAT family N-acetyltransferase [Rhodopseudomonas palustris]|nr:GNAT family N-acetyltransferase [Rhodopseudomonas palustris]